MPMMPEWRRRNHPPTYGLKFSRLLGEARCDVVPALQAQPVTL